MKVKLLKRLRKKYQIVGQEIDVIKYLYSIKGLDGYHGGDPENAIWCTRSHSECLEKQRELILQRLARIRNRWMFKFLESIKLEDK